MKKSFLLLLATASLLFGAQDQGHEDHAATIHFTGDIHYLNNSKDTHDTETPGLSHEHAGHAHGAKEGFSPSYAEVEVIVPIGEKFEVVGVAHMDDGVFDLEELYATTYNKKGMNYKAGKFLSSFGKNNVLHKHDWNFSTQPLINNLLLGDHGLQEKGLSATWNNRNLLVGLEVLKGENEDSFGRIGVNDTTNNITIAEQDGLELVVAYLKYKHQFGSTFVNAGISYASGDTIQDHTSDATPHALKASTKLKGLDVEVKVPFTRNSGITWINEYIKREMDGTEYGANNVPDTHEKSQSGFYSSLLYKLNPKYTVGVRYDKILENDVLEGAVNAGHTDDIKRTTALMEYNISENNRLRVQYTQDRSKFDETSGDLIKNNELIVQYTFNFSTGKHEH